MKILTVVGARPQFIKAAVVSNAIERTQGMKEVLVHTGQHYDPNMSDVFFQELGIAPPRFSLNVGSGPHGAQTGRMLEQIESIIQDENPNWVLVYGDTNSTLAGALAAAKLHVPVAHVEAGVRSYDRRMPEEVNRVITDVISTRLFAPTPTAVRNLALEGIVGEKVIDVGDVMYDATLLFAARAMHQSQIIEDLRLTSGNFVLATVHRAENTDDIRRLTNIAHALIEIGRTERVVFPLHPRTGAALRRAGLYEAVERACECIAPVGYLEMLNLQQSARLVVTDSGGVQKEAYFVGTPCVVLRDRTEWVELVEAGASRLAPPQDVATLVAAVTSQRAPMTERINAFGDGRAAEKIANSLAGLE